jgi:predicted GTPase
VEITSKIEPKTIEVRYVDVYFSSGRHETFVLYPEDTQFTAGDVMTITITEQAVTKNFKRVAETIEIIREPGMQVNYTKRTVTLPPDPADGPPHAPAA